MYKKIIDRIKIIETEKKILSLKWHIIIYWWIAPQKNSSQYSIENSNNKFKSVILLLVVVTLPSLNQEFQLFNLKFMGSGKVKVAIKWFHFMLLLIMICLWNY
jgi:hypothetical protein